MDLGEEADIRPLARIGSTIGGAWRIEDLLGIGGAATVYAAVHASGRRAALKIMHRRLRDDLALRDRFFLEAELARLIDHPARVVVHGIGATDDGAPMIMMELLDGCTLEAVVARTGRLNTAAALMIGEQVLSFLSVCHDRGIVHRDIKPSNIMLTSAGSVKMLDLGVALVGQRRVTTKRLAIGTPNYMAPEQARGSRDIDGRADVFAVGALLFHLLSGIQPRTAPTPREVLRAAAGEPIRSVRLVAPDLPNAVVELVDRATSFDRSARWPDARTMRETMLACLAATGWSPITLAEICRATLEREDPSAQRPTVPDVPRSVRPALQATHLLEPLVVAT